MWNDFHGLCKGLAVAIASYALDLVLAIGRGGLYPGTLLAFMLQIDLVLIMLTRRVGDKVRYPHPCWILKPPESVKDKKVLIVDEIFSTGETLGMVKE